MRRYFITHIIIRLILILGIVLGINSPHLARAEDLILPEAISNPIVIKNTGQFHPSARFLMQGEGGTFWLAKNSLWLTVLEPKSQPDILDDDASLSPEPLRGVNVHLSFEDANPNPILEPFNPLKTQLSYLLGKNRNDWHTKVPVYGGVRYRDLYPGVDLVIGGGVISSQTPLPWHLEADTTSALDAVKLQIAGVEDVDRFNGTVQLETEVGTFDLALPSVVGKDRQVDPSALSRNTDVQPTAENQYAINSPFDTSKDYDSLDQTSSSEDINYSTFLGGNSVDTGSDITVDSDGYAYLVGHTSSFDFPGNPWGF